MRPVRIELDGHRSVEDVAFEAAPFTILFGQNNAGKTNILEAIYLLLSGEAPAGRRPVVGRDSNLCGGLWVELEPKLDFDEAVASAIQLELPMPMDTYVRFGRGDRIDVGSPHGSADWGSDYDEMHPPDQDEMLWARRLDHSATGPRPHVLLMDWEFAALHQRVESFISGSAGKAWVESLGMIEGGYGYRVPQRTHDAVASVVALANEFLPDFVEGSIQGHVTAPELWDRLPRVILEFAEQGATQCADVVELAGSGAARWIAASIELALHFLREGVLSLGDRNTRGTGSGHVLLLDEPEAHLHPGAVASIVRWCHRMNRHGMSVFVASHHEEFLRTPGPEARLVHVTRDPDRVASRARALTSNAVSVLRELAEDVGLHPAAALSLQRAVLFVEGPLDVAVLDEYASLRFDALGILLVPIHGTKNLEGLVTGEVVTRLGLRLGVLTDATEVASLADRPNKRRSSEEKKVLRVLALAEERNLAAPAVFGVAEDDLLFALPADAISDYLGRDFPGWRELVAEARRATGADPSESVNWKAFANEQYGLPIEDAAGVREVVRHLDLRGVALPSIERVVSEVELWAADGPDRAAKA